MIDLSINTPEEEVNIRIHVWPLKITATSSDVALSNKIFIYSRTHLDGDDIFITVADVIELEIVPEDNPDNDGVLYRTSTVEFGCRSEDERNNVIEQITSSVADLNNEWESNKNSAAETYTA